MYSFCAPDDERRNRLKYVEQFIEINRSRKRCILLVVLQRHTCDARTCERQIGTNVTPLIFFSETIITFTITFRYHSTVQYSTVQYSTVQYILYKVEVMFPQSLLHYQHFFHLSVRCCLSVCLSRVELC